MAETLTVKLASPTKLYKEEEILKLIVKVNELIAGTGKVISVEFTQCRAIK